MSKFDNELLFLHAENARAKIKDISSALRKSSQRVKYSIKVMESEGLTTNPFCVFDYSYFGLILFRVYYKGGYIGEKDRARIIRKLEENQYISSIYELNGEFDLAVEFIAPNPSRFNKELKKVSELVPTLNNYKVILNLVTHIYTRAYLVKGSKTIKDGHREIVIGGDRNIESFSKGEMSVMHILLKHPRARLVGIARETGLNIKTVKTVVAGLGNKKAIKGFKYVVDPNKLGAYRFRLFLKLHNLLAEREAQLMEYLYNTHEIIQVNKTVGDWDIEIDLESRDKAMTRYRIHHLRQEFTDIIETFNIIEFYQYYKRSFLPESLFA